MSLMDPQNPSNIEAMKQYVESFENGGTPSLEGSAVKPSVPTSASTLTGEALEKVISSSVIEGNKNADILVIEYSDTECPFCIRQYHDTKLWPTLRAEYGDKVAFAFKNNR